MSQEPEEEKSFFDMRMMRPLEVVIKKENTRVILSQTDTFDVNNKKVSYISPNIVAIFANIAHRNGKDAQELYNTFIKPKLKQKGEVRFANEENSRLFDYFELIQTAIIALYTAVEAFANAAIPGDYSHEETTAKGIKEIWDKDALERWKLTSEKLTKILPVILKTESPIKEKFWSNFKEFEVLRNDIVHQKSSTRNPNELDKLFLRKLLHENVFNKLNSGFLLISFFCEKNKSHGLFPFGFSEIEIEPMEIDDFSEYFEALDDEKPEESKQ